MSKAVTSGNGRSGTPTVEQFVNGTLAPDETLFERRMRAVMLRNAGGTFTQIAAQLNVSAAQARKDVAAGLREIMAESREEIIARHKGALLDVWKANYGRMMSGDVDAARLILSSMEREAKLMGLDAPTRVSVGVSELDFAEKAASLIELVGGTAPPELLKLLPRRAPAIEADVVDCTEVPAPESVDAEPDIPPRADWSNI